MTKRSEYIINKAIGPGVIDQLTYLDRAKAVLHVSGVIPVPDRHIDLVIGASTFVGKGNILRLLPGADHHIAFGPTSTNLVTDSTTEGGVFLSANVEYFIVAAEDYIRGDATAVFRVEITAD